MPAAALPATALLRNGVRMSAAFAGNEGALLAVVSLSAGLIEPRTAGLANGTLYMSFALGCLASPSVVRRLGDRRSLVLGTSAYALFCAAYMAPSAAGLPIAGAAAGACGAVLWTAQGRYFSLNARLHARAAAREAGCPVDAQAESQAVSTFATLFAVLFPLSLALFKVMAAVILALTGGGHVAVYAFLAAAAGASVWLMTGVADLDGGEGEGAARAEETAAEVATEVWRAHAREPLLLLLLPTNVAFGLCTAFFPYAVTLLAKETLGVSAIGWLYALANLVSSSVAAACGVASRRHGAAGRRASLTLGAAAFAAATGSVYARGPGQGAWGAGSLSLLFILYGIGTAVWQGSVMAFFGDAFVGEKALPAFSSLKLQSGLASALAFFILPGADRRSAAAVCALCSALGLACYWPAETQLQARLAATAAAATASAECELVQAAGGEEEAAALLG